TANSTQAVRYRTWQRSRTSCSASSEERNEPPLQVWPRSGTTAIARCSDSARYKASTDSAVARGAKGMVSIILRNKAARSVSGIISDVGGPATAWTGAAMTDGEGSDVTAGDGFVVLGDATVSGLAGSDGGVCTRRSASTTRLPEA